MTILFVGCLEISRTMLNILLENDEEICGIICVPERFKESTSGYDDLSDIATQNNTPLFKARRLHFNGCIEFIKKCQPDMMIVYGWQRIIKPEVLKLVDKCIGFHASLLPKYRGSAPVNWAIINGESETGVTMFELNEEVDAGPIYGQKAFSIELHDTCATVYEKSADAACELILEGLQNGFHASPNTSSNYPVMPRRRPEDGLVDWTKSNFEIYNWIRALTKPYPGAFTIIDNKKHILWESIIGHYDLPQSLQPGEHKFINGGIVFGTADHNLLVTNYEVYNEN